MTLFLITPAMKGAIGLVIVFIWLTIQNGGSGLASGRLWFWSVVAGLGISAGLLAGLSYALFIILGVIGAGFSFFIYIVGLQHTTPTTACVVAMLEPGTASACGVIFLDERLRGLQAAHGDVRPPYKNHAPSRLYDDDQPKSHHFPPHPCPIKTTKDLRCATYRPTSLSSSAPLIEYAFH